MITLLNKCASVPDVENRGWCFKLLGYCSRSRVLTYEGFWLLIRGSYSIRGEILCVGGRGREKAIKVLGYFFLKYYR